ncbi:hypothetical protein NSQ62_08055 [Solibacillus sp. FSL H8-0523]|uniref:hypothetical protein n=1 Tax=Solibacillus sp. FSL H8-0523 TaxID=2954511 RepID=UPI003100C613
MTVKTIDGEKFVACVECGHDVHLYSMWASECVCGVEYNGFGQQLASRKQWDMEEDF